MMTQLSAFLRAMGDRRVPDWGPWPCASTPA